jgi:magnesium-transporting ATPase (P-type)
MPKTPGDEYLCEEEFPCVANCPRLKFFCDMGQNNPVWFNTRSYEYYDMNKDFSSYRIDALSSAQSGYLFTIVLGQMATMLCVKTRFTSLFKRGLDNFYVNLSFPISLAVIVFVVFPPFTQSFFLTASFNGKYIGYILCMLPIPVSPPSHIPFAIFYSSIDVVGLHCLISFCR